MQLEMDKKRLKDVISVSLLQLKSEKWLWLLKNKDF